MDHELLKLFFPGELVAHFDLTGSSLKAGKHGDYLEVEFTERNELPEGYPTEDYEAKDFVEKGSADFSGEQDKLGEDFHESEEEVFGVCNAS
jgi:topoisomerase IA-like protein